MQSLLRRISMQFKYRPQFVRSSTENLFVAIFQLFMKQTRALYARANTIIRKFSAASLSIKLLLFRAYCTPLYGCQLWCSMFQYSYRKLNVAYNDVFRQLLQQPRWCSASQLFVLNNVPTFSAICVSSCIHCIARSESLTMFSYKLH